MATNKVKILDCLAGRTEASATQISELTGVKNGLHVFIQRLEAAGLVTAKLVARAPDVGGFLKFIKITKNGRLYLKSQQMAAKATAGGK